MDAFDYTDRTRPVRRIGALIFNILTVLILLATICVLGVFATIFVNPYSGLNVFPPPTLPVLVDFPTATPTPRQALPPTWTPLPTEEPTQTFTPEPSGTPQPSATLPPSPTAFPLFSATPTSEAGESSMPFVVADGSPVAITSSAFRPEAGCSWLGVAGQVFDMSGAPIATGITIRLEGVLGGQYKNLLSLTGAARDRYGESAYEFELGDEPVASNNTLYVQLLDQAGLPMSEKIFFETFDACDKNLILINFKQVR